MSNNRREFLKGAGYIGLGVGGLVTLVVLNDRSIRQDEEAERAYQRHLTETPVPEKMSEMDEFTDEMRALYPAYKLSLEHIRTGKYNEDSKSFDIDRYHIVFNLDPETRPDQLLSELTGLYGYIRETNKDESNVPIDLIGISEQIRRFNQPETWAQDRPLVIPERTPEAFVGIAFRTTVSDVETFRVVMLDGQQLSHVNALPQNRTVYTNDSLENPRAPFLFDAATRVEAPSVYTF